RRALVGEPHVRHFRRDGCRSLGAGTRGSEPVRGCGGPLPRHAAALARAALLTERGKERKIRGMMPRTIQGGPYPQTHAPADVIHLGLGQPSPSLLPLQAFADAAARRLQRETDPLLLQYGVAAGHAGFREALARFLSGRLGMPVDAEHLFASPGVSASLAWVSTTLARPGDAVACGDPTYFLAHGIFRDAGLRLHGVPVDADGLCVERLE